MARPRHERYGRRVGAFETYSACSGAEWAGSALDRVVNGSCGAPGGRALAIDGPGVHLPDAPARWSLDGPAWPGKAIGAAPSAAGAT